MLYLFNKYIDHIIKENSLTTSDELRKRVKENLDKLDKLILVLIKSYLLAKMNLNIQNQTRHENSTTNDFQVSPIIYGV